MNATHFNFADHLFQLNKARASKLAFIDDTRTLSYGERAASSPYGCKPCPAWPTA